MPEGDTLLRLAAKVAERFAGERVTSSVFRHPRLALLDLTGLTLVSAEAAGKNLFLRFDDGRSLHVHLLMQGRVRFGRSPDTEEWRRRFEITFADGQMTGIDIPRLHLIDTAREHEFTDHLGPDLCGVYDPGAALARLAEQAGVALTGALLDQRVVAGFGNIYAVETPFVLGLSPFVPVGEVDDLEAVLSVGAALIRTNAARGPQNTTGRRLSTNDQWVLPRRVRTCAICGTGIQRRYEDQTPWQRRVSWCPTCQHDTHRQADLARARKLLTLHPARRMVDFDTGSFTGSTDQKVELSSQGGREY